MDADLRADDLVSLARHLVHHDQAADLHARRRRLVAGELAPERRRETAGGRRGEQLLGARLALWLADPRGEGVGQAGERAGVSADRPGATGDTAFPFDLCAAFDS